MRLLLINPNTSQHITERMAKVAAEVAGPGVDIKSVTATFGPAVIASRTEHAVAAHGALDLAARHGAETDAIVLGVSLDSGLLAVRELCDVPVTSMTEAALLTACMLGGRIGLLTLGPQLLPVYQELAASYGLAQRVVGWQALNLPSAYQDAAIDIAVTEALREAIAEMAVRQQIDVVVLAGAVLAGYARRLRGQVEIPVIDAIEAATLQAIALVALDCGPAGAGSLRAPKRRRSTGLSAALEARLARE